MVRSIIFLLILFFVNNLSFSQDKIIDIEKFYESDLIKINYQLFGGLTLGYQGMTTSTQFGIPENFKNSLNAYPDVKEYIDSYSILNLTGNIFLYGGLTTILVSYVPLMNTITSYSSYQNQQENLRLTYGLLIGGLIAELIGATILPSSYEKLTQGVNLYNKKKLIEYSY